MPPRQVKPDGVERGLSGEIISRFETKGLHLIACRMRYAGKEILEQHYHHIAYKSFFPQHLAYMQSAPVITMVFEGANAIAAGRYLHFISSRWHAARRHRHHRHCRRRHHHHR